MRRLATPLRRAFLAAESGFDRLFGPAWNPLYQLGALAFFFLWVVVASGIYLYVFFDTSVAGAYASVERLTHVQWYAGGVMRSLHRYASDGLVAAMMLHLLREFAHDRYRGARWFAWLTGVPALWLVFAAGINGYWLVWDGLGQYVAILTSEWLDWLPIFGEPMARNFLAPDSLSDRFFSLLVFLHIVLPLLLVIALWLHLQRLTRPVVNPARGLALGTLGMLLALSLAKPAVSHAAADLALVPAVLRLDWYYLWLYPLIDVWPEGVVWAAVAGATVALAALPWLPPPRQPRAATVQLDQCNGCGRCVADCPFAAVAMARRSDGRPFLEEAVVDPDLCTSCGICVGACPTSTPFRRAEELTTGIDLPDFSLADLRDATERAAGRLSASGPRVLVFGCDHGTALDGLAQGAVRLPCVGLLPPPFIDYALARGLADGIALAGCAEGSCHFRHGIRWTEDRIAGRRDPYLRARVPRERIATVWAGPAGRRRVAHELDRFRARLEPLAPAPSDETALRVGREGQAASDD